MVKKGKKSLKNGSPVDNVDTSSMNLKQLQSFCERVYKEVVKVELESRSLELERAKLKTMVELSTKELIKVKRNRREKEFDLENMCETIEFGRMDLQKQLRNVSNEKSKETLLFMTVVNNNIQIKQNYSSECKTNIEQDIKIIRSKLARLESHKNSQTIVLMKQLEEEKSNLINAFDNYTKLQATEYEKHCSEISSKLKNKYLEAFEALNAYKNREISGHLNENDKLMTCLQHYYERLQQHNMNVLNGVHEEYKRVKVDVGQVTSTFKNHKDIANKCNHELKSNNEKIKELSSKLANMEQDQNVLKKTKVNLTSLTNSLKNKRLNYLFLEQAVEMMKEKRLKSIENNEKNLICLQKNIARKILRLECMEMNIRTNLEKMNKIIETHDPNVSKNLSMPQIRKIVIAQLEEEAKQEENPILKNNLDAPTTSGTRKSVGLHPTVRKINFIYSQIN